LEGCVGIYKVPVHNCPDFIPSVCQCFIHSRLLSASESYAFPGPNVSGSDSSSSSSSIGPGTVALIVVRCTAGAYWHSRIRCPAALQRKQSLFSRRFSFSVASTHLARGFPFVALVRSPRVPEPFLRLPFMGIGAITVSPSASTWVETGCPWERVVTVAFGAGSLLFSFTLWYTQTDNVRQVAAERLVYRKSRVPKKLDQERY
jgi:hypothetical protein